MQRLIDRTGGRGGAPANGRYSQTVAEPRDPLTRIIGESPGIREAKQTLRLHACFPTSVLILGATGTGKGLAAEVLHEQSRRPGEFVLVNCATIQSDLAESQLFGHEQGSFTDAKKKRVGAVERAHQGTLFLDEITELPGRLQAKLLTVLDDGWFETVGGSKAKRSEFRLVAATSADLGELVDQRRFREDLYFRIKACTIQLPDLSDRGFDVVLLGRSLLHHISRDIGREVRIAPGAEQLLLQRPWPGNVRQLANTLMLATVRSEDGLIDEATMDDVLDNAEESGPRSARWIPTMEEAVERARREAIERAFAATGRDLAKAARLLDISPSTLYRYRRELGME